MKHLYICMITIIYAAAISFSPITAQEVTSVTEANTADLYGIGSISKVFTASAVMKLCDMGLLDLDTPITEYIEEFTMADARYTKITPRMLLNHSSGFYGTTDNNAMLLGDNSTYAHDTLLEQLKIQRLKHDPGDRSIYCNDGFTLAEILVERVSGKTFMKFLQSEFFEPLGLQDIYAPTNLFDRSRLAPISYGSLSMKEENLNLIGSGGLYASAEELCLFSRIFTEEFDILSAESKKEMMQFECQGAFIDETDDTVFGYGLGWDSVTTYPFEGMGIKALAKGGGTVFYHSNLTVLPDYGLSVAVLSSGQVNYEQLIAQEIILAVLEEEGLIENKKIEIPDFAETTQPIDQKWLSFTGLYSGISLMNIYFEGNELVIVPIGVKNEREFRFLHIGDGRFISQDGNYIGLGALTAAEGGNTGITQVKFVENELGEQYLFASGYMEAAGLSKTAISLPFAEKVLVNDIGEETIKSWEQRAEQDYLLVNETYNSSQYLHGAIARLYVDESGYIQEGIYEITGFEITGAKIADKDTALPYQKTPIQVGRDANEIKMLSEGNKEILDIKGYQFISEKEIGVTKEIEDMILIPANGQAQWFRISEEQNRETWEIVLPEQGSYFVYDSKFECVASSLEKKAGTQISLPEDGYLVFVGEAGVSFIIDK